MGRTDLERIHTEPVFWSADFCLATREEIAGWPLAAPDPQGGKKAALEQAVGQRLCPTLLVLGSAPQSGGAP